MKLCLRITTAGADGVIGQPSLHAIDIAPWTRVPQNGIFIPSQCRTAIIK
nr:hypothetical protein 398p2_00002 [Serratia entomophila]